MYVYININTHIFVCIRVYKCNYVSSSKSGLRLVVNKKSFSNSSAF